MQESFIRKDHVRSGRLLAPSRQGRRSPAYRRAREALRAGLIRALQALGALQAGLIRALQALGALRARFLSLCKPLAREAMSPSLKRIM